MGKVVSRDMALEVNGRHSTLVNWDKIDGEKLQLEVIGLSAEEYSRRMTAFYANGMRFVFGGLKVATASFDPVKFIGAGWSAIPEEQDKASAALTEVDFDKAELLTCLEKGESSITGEEKLVRLRKSGRVLFGTTVFAGLWQDYQSCQNKSESVLERLYQQKGVGYIDFFGDILLSPFGNRCVLCLARPDGGQWRWHCHWLGTAWRDRPFSAVSQQVS